MLLLYQAPLLKERCMDANFWHEKWETNRIGFHESQPNPLLVAHFHSLSLRQGSRIFVPLCGKTLGIAWLLSNGYRVAGAELSEMAIRQLFAELGIEPEVTDVGDLKHYHATDIDIFVGDVFAVTREMLGDVDAVFDRAALVALPEAIRIQYTNYIKDITDYAPQLLITFEYDQRLMNGPPFSVTGEEVSRHYASDYDISPLATEDIGLKGTQAVSEKVWLLQSVNNRG